MFSPAASNWEATMMIAIHGFGFRTAGVLALVALPACSSLGGSAERTRATRSALGVSPATWHAEGPASIAQCGNTFPANLASCSGAANQPVVDPTTGAIYVATVNGGIFKTTTPNSIFAPTPTAVHWVPQTDDRESLTTRALAMD